MGLSTTFNAAYTMRGLIAGSLSPADSTTYYFGFGSNVTISAHTTWSNCAMTVPRAGVITTVEFSVFIGTNGSNEQVTHAIRKNDTTDTNLSTTETYNPGNNTVKLFRYTGLSIPVVRDDTIAFKVVTPAWGTNPTITCGDLMIFIE